MTKPLMFKKAETILMRRVVGQPRPSTNAEN
jgi:hypothetical protein